MKIRNIFVQFVFITILVLVGIGCQNTNPVDPMNAHTPIKSGIVSSLVNSTVGSVVQDLNFITLPCAKNGPLPASIRTVSGVISAANGGTLNLSYSYISTLGTTVVVKASLTVPPGAVQQNTTVTMTMDNSRALLEFGPDGLVFKQPALLNVNVSGLSITNLLNGLQSSCYWYDESHEDWVKMPAQSIISDILHLTFTCKNAQLPHFSRYGFGR